MPEENVITTAQSTDLVTYKVLVDGEELSSRFQILTISVEKELNRIPWAKIVLLDGDPATRDFVLSNEEFFVPGREVEIKAGYHSDEETIFKGLVIRHNLKIRSDRAQLIVECKDKAVKLTVGRKSKYYYQSKDSDILEEIISTYNLEASVEATNTEHQEVVQYRLADWDFCVTRAQANGKVCLIDDGTLAIKTPALNDSEKHSLVYGANILDFDAEIDARNQYQQVASSGWDCANQEVIEKEEDISEITLNGNINSADLASVIGLQKLEVNDVSIHSDAGLQDWANARSYFAQLAKIRGRIKFQGVADVKPDTTLNLSGVGDRFNGKVYVSAVRHQISEGNWTIDAQFGINPEWFSESIEINETPASGLWGAIQGLHIAIVSQLSDDPDGEMRVKVRMPMIDNQEEGVWARVVSPDAGSNRGIFFRPELDDEVIVGFLNSNPNAPVILGMLHSSAKPSPLEPSEDNHEKGIFTRSEMKFVFDDDKKAVVLETPSGKKITVDEDAGVIQLEDENSNVITMNADGVVIESASDLTLTASGDVSIEGTNVQLTANAEFKAEGSAGSKLESGGTTEIKGAIVNIN